MRARLCSQDTFVPGERPAGQVRGRKADALGEVSAPVAWGLGNWTVAVGNGGPGGHRVGTANSVTPTTRAGAPFLSDPSPGRAASLLTQMCGDQGRRGGGRRAAPTLLRGTGRSPVAGYTKAAPEAPARPLPRCPRADQPPLASQSGRPRCPPPALGSPVRRGLLRRPARGPPANPCPPARPLIGGGGAPGQRPPNNTFASPPPPAA